jgi:hypothetical protein
VVQKVISVFRALLGLAEAPSPSPLLAAVLVEHGLGPYAFAQLETWRDVLRPSIVATLAKAKARAAHLQDAVGALGGIRVIALKGLDYAQSLYDDEALRPMHDHDLLVREEDYARAYAALMRAGFREAVVQVGVATHPQHYAAQLVRGGYGLDLHRAIRQAVRAEVDYAAVFAAATPRRDGVWVPAPPHRLLLHCLHMAGHECVGPLIGFLDLEHMMPALDDRVWPLARQWRVSHALSAALRLRARLRGDPLPHAFHGESLLPSLTRLADPRDKQPRLLQLGRKLVLIDDWQHRLAFARYALEH